MVSAPGQWRKHFRDARNERGDAQVAVVGARGIRMDARFVARLERAIARGEGEPFPDESTEGAVAQGELKRI